MLGQFRPAEREKQMIKGEARINAARRAARVGDRVSEDMKTSQDIPKENVLIKVGQVTLTPSSVRVGYDHHWITFSRKGKAELVSGPVFLSSPLIACKTIEARRLAKEVLFLLNYMEETDS